MAVDELIEVIARGALEAVQTLSGREFVGPCIRAKPPAKSPGVVASR
jgi:hypothetical protein